MKNTADGGVPAIPASETKNCSYIRRNSDIAVGTEADLFFHMQYAGHYVCLRDFHIKRQMASSALLLLTLSGEGELIYGKSRYHLGRGACMFIDAGKKHEYYPLADGWEFKYIHFTGCMTREYLSYAESRSGPVHYLSAGSTENMDALISRVLDETEDEVTDDYPGISRDIYSMMITLISRSVSPDGGGRGSGPAMIKAVQFIRRNSASNISTDDIAAEVSLSRPYMSKLFSRAYGIPPHEYLTRYRVSSAKNLLVTTSLSVTEIAERTGFRDLFSFSRIFRRMTGISPTEYRERYRV